MRLDALAAAFPAWAGTLPPSRRQANTREGVPVARRPVEPGTVLSRRLALGLTQAQVADRLGVARHTIQRLEARPLHQRGVRADVRRFRARLNEFYLALERKREAS
jgi:hypothetical protein